MNNATGLDRSNVIVHRKSMSLNNPDIVIVGGGIVGLATALELQGRLAGSKIVVLEKEEDVALHQTGRNSGVIHAGVYYKPGSLKARFCRDGKAAMKAFCAEHGIPFEICGKLIVATDEPEAVKLDALEARARENGIPVERITGDDAKKMEPWVSSVAALLSPSTGIVDYGLVARRMAMLFEGHGGTIRRGVSVLGGMERADDVILHTSAGDISTARTVFCAGLHSDRLARRFGAAVDFRIVPFRGEYFRIANQPSDLVRHLIYPVPDPERPFLGVHLTRKIDGGFTVGPNAVLAFKREGYQRTDINLRDLASSLAYPGFWRLVRRNLSSAASELAGSASKSLYLRKVQKYCPHIQLADLVPYRAGVRAQAVSRDGVIIDDFLFVDGRNSLHVCNAPSPAATSALPIAEFIADRLLKPDRREHNALPRP